MRISSKKKELAINLWATDLNSSCNFGLRRIPLACSLSPSIWGTSSILVVLEAYFQRHFEWSYLILPTVVQSNYLLEYRNTSEFSWCKCLLTNILELIRHTFDCEWQRQWRWRKHIGSLSKAFEQKNRAYSSRKILPSGSLSVQTL